MYHKLKNNDIKKRFFFHYISMNFIPKWFVGCTLCQFTRYHNIINLFYRFFTTFFESLWIIWWFGNKCLTLNSVLYFPGDNFDPIFRANVYLSILPLICSLLLQYNLILHKELTMNLKNNIRILWIFSYDICFCNIAKQEHVYTCTIIVHGTI